MWVSDVTCERSSYCIFDFDLYFCSLLAALSKSLYHLPLGSFMLFQVVYHNVLCQILQKFLFLWHILSFDNVWILLFDNVICVCTLLYVWIQFYLCVCSTISVRTVLFTCVHWLFLRTILFRWLNFEPFNLNILNILNTI